MDLKATREHALEFFKESLAGRTGRKYRVPFILVSDASIRAHRRRIAFGKKASMGLEDHHFFLTLFSHTSNNKEKLTH